MKYVRAHNPAELLTIVNPRKRRTNMKRRATNTRRRTVSASNPRRRRNRHHSVALVNPRRRRRTVHARAANPRRRVNRRRRRNPQIKSVIMGALWAGAGAALTNIVAGFIPLSGGGWMDTLKQLAAAYGVAYLAERFTSPANAQLMAIGGFSGTAWSAVNTLLGQAGSGFSSITSMFNPPPQVAAGPGVNDIVQAPDFYNPGMGDIVEAPEFYYNAAQ